MADDMETLLDTLASNYAAFSGTGTQKRQVETGVDDAAPWQARRRKRLGDTSANTPQVSIPFLDATLPALEAPTNSPQALANTLQAPTPDTFDEGEPLQSFLALPVEAPEDDADSCKRNTSVPHTLDPLIAALRVRTPDVGAASEQHSAQDNIETSGQDKIETSELETEFLEDELAETDALCIGMVDGIDNFDDHDLEDTLAGVCTFDVYSNDSALANALDPYDMGEAIEDGLASDLAINGNAELTLESEPTMPVISELEVGDPDEINQGESNGEHATVADDLNVELDFNDDEETRLAEIIAAEFGSLLTTGTNTSGVEAAEELSTSVVKSPGEESKVVETLPEEKVAEEKADAEEKLLAEEAMQAMLCGDAAKYEELNKKLEEVQAAKARLAERKRPAPVVRPSVPETNQNGGQAAPQPLGACEFVEFQALGELATFTSSSSSDTGIQEAEVRVLDCYGVLIEDSPRYTFFGDPIFPIGIMTDLAQAGFSRPSPIQQYAWPLALQMRDLIGIAATGSGKTLAFLLPAFSHILQNGLPATLPSLLVLAPTRELASQIDAEAKRFGTRSGLRTVCVYGGASKHAQVRELQVGAHGVIGTPGRLNDLLDSGELDLQYVTKLVMDEADRMLDMGFEPQIRSIIRRVPEHRQTLFFTATWPLSIQQLASEFVRDAYRVQVGEVDVLKGNSDITQIVTICRGQTKPQMLIAALRQAGVTDPKNAHTKGLVFCNTKNLCDSLAMQLSAGGVACNTIHGGKDQRQREWALNELKTGRTKILVATDVAARGLDIRGVSLVINYDAPYGAEDYVHRIGRTGRAGQKGFAISLISDYDMWALPDIVKVMRESNQIVSPEVELLARNPRSFQRMVGKGKGKDRGKSKGAARLELEQEPTKAVPSLSSVSSLLRDRDRSRSRERANAKASPVPAEPEFSKAVELGNVTTSRSNVEICD